MKRGLLLILTILLYTTQGAFAAPKLKLIIDAGHGGTDAGSKSKAGDKESDICLQLAMAVQEYAKQSGVEVVMTRTKAKQTLTYQERSGYTPTPGVKTFYISIHFDNDNDHSKHGARIRYSDNAAASYDAKRLAMTLAKSLEKLNGMPTQTAVVDAVVFMKNKVPSILIEPGRMTWPADLKRVKEKEYQKELASYIVQAALAQ